MGLHTILKKIKLKVRRPHRPRTASTRWGLRAGGEPHNPIHL